jgi:hypothetical protein
MACKSPLLTGIREAFSPRPGGVKDLSAEVSRWPVNLVVGVGVARSSIPRADQSLSWSSGAVNRAKTAEAFSRLASR